MTKRVSTRGGEPGLRLLGDPSEVPRAQADLRAGGHGEAWISISIGRAEKKEKSVQLLLSEERRKRKRKRDVVTIKSNKMFQLKSQPT